MDFEEIKEQPMVSYFWKGLALFLLGVLVGILVSPIKNGVSIGNNNTVCGCDDDEDDEQEYFEDE